jgi:hypothetical protein
VRRCPRSGAPESVTGTMMKIADMTERALAAVKNAVAGA